MPIPTPITIAIAASKNSTGTVDSVQSIFECHWFHLYILSNTIATNTLKCTMTKFNIVSCMLCHLSVFGEQSFIMNWNIIFLFYSSFSFLMLEIHGEYMWWKLWAFSNFLSILLAFYSPYMVGTDQLWNGWRTPSLGEKIQHGCLICYGQWIPFLS